MIPTSNTRWNLEERRVTLEPAMSVATSYYYADGQRVPLALAPEYVAVDFARDHAITGLDRERLQREAEPLIRGIVLVHSAALSEHQRAILDEEGALHPVYRHGSAVLIVLPEVRVDITRAQRRSVLSFVKKSPLPASVEVDEGEQLVLRPASGKGIDALELANRLHEATHPKMAQARFLRIIPRSAI